MGVQIPLFPLSTVLVPGLVLPLHIHEPRYQVLIEALTQLPEDATRQFGVIAYRHGTHLTGADEPPELYEVGCTADVREVTPYPDGRYDIVAVGEQRFRLLQVLDEPDVPYLMGEVELLSEVDGSGDVAAITAAAVRQFSQYRQRLGVEQTQLPDEPRVISYLIAAAVVLDLPQRQRLLAQPTTMQRLCAEIELMRYERRLISATATLPATELVATTTVSAN